MEGCAEGCLGVPCPPRPPAVPTPLTPRGAPLPPPSFPPPPPAPPSPAEQRCPRAAPGAKGTSRPASRRAGAGPPLPPRRGPRWRARPPGRAEGPPAPRCPSSPPATGRAAGRRGRPRGRARGSGGLRRPAQPGPAHVVPRLKCRSQGSLVGRQISWQPFSPHAPATTSSSSSSSAELGEPRGRAPPGAPEAWSPSLGAGLRLGFRAAPEAPRSEEWVSGREPQEGSSAVKRGGAPVRRHVPPPQLPY